MSENQNIETKKCKHCQSDIPKKAKVCPQCGKKQGGALKWIIIAIVALIIIGSASGGEDEPKKVENNNPGTSVSTEAAAVETKVIEYQSVNISDLISTLKANALKAEKTYQDAYVEITGYLSNIDSDGDYVSITATKDAWDFDTVQCYITDDAQLDIVLEKSVGDEVTIKGQITSIGEILGYSLDIDEIK